MPLLVDLYLFFLLTFTACEITASPQYDATFLNLFKGPRRTLDRGDYDPIQRIQSYVKSLLLLIQTK